MLASIPAPWILWETIPQHKRSLSVEKRTVAINEKKTNQRQASESVGPRVHPQRARPREPDAKPVKFIGGS